MCWHMMEYACCFVFLLTLCSVSTFRVYYPGDLEQVQHDDTVVFVADQLTALCVGLCLEHERSADAAICRAWCRSPLDELRNAAALPSSPRPLPSRHHGHEQLRGNEGEQKKQLLTGEEQDTDVEENREGLSRGNIGRSKGRRYGEGELDDGGDDDSRLARRLVDPLLSCIEEHCAGLGSVSYDQCVYAKCITGRRWKRWGGETGNGNHDDGKASWGVNDAVRSRGRGRSRAGGSGSGSSRTGRGSPQQRTSWTNALVAKRSWNDVMQTCIEYNCAHTSPGSFKYNVCLQQSCSKHMFGR